MAGRVLVLGIGNRIRCDDAVGLEIVGQLRQELKNPDIDIRETEETRLALLDLIEGYGRVIIVDSIRARPDEKPGGILRFTADELDADPRGEQHSSHAMGIPSLLAIGQQHNLPIPKPENITLIAVTIPAATADQFGEQLSPEIEAAIPKAIARIRQELAL